MNVWDWLSRIVNVIQIVIWIVGGIIATVVGVGTYITGYDWPWIVLASLLGFLLVLLIAKQIIPFIPWSVRNLDKLSPDAPPPTLYEIGQHEKKKLEQRVSVKPLRFDYSRVKGLNPCFVMTFGIFNASVYRIAVVGVSGTFRVDKEVFPGTPDIKVKPPFVDHGGHGCVTLSLLLNQDTARLIMSKENVGGRLQIDFMELGILFVAEQVDAKQRIAPIHNCVVYEYRQGQWVQSPH